MSGSLRKEPAYAAPGFIEKLARDSRKRPQAEGTKSAGMVRLYVWNSVDFTQWVVKNNLVPKDTNTLFWMDRPFFQSHCRVYALDGYLVELFWLDVPVFPALLQAIGELRREDIKYRMRVYA